MTKIIRLLYMFASLFLINVSDAYFCDGYTEGEICNSGSTIESIDNINDFNSEYNDINLGYFGNNFNNIFSNELWSTLGFLGTNKTTKSPNYQYYQLPIGNFGLYKNKVLQFNEIENENDLSTYPLVLYGQDNQNINHSNSIDTKNLGICNVPNSISNTKVEIKNNGLLDFLHITWNNSGNEKVKIIRNSPEYKEIYVFSGSSFYDDFDLRNGSHSYFVVAYNDCFKSGIYSDLLKINYDGKVDEILTNLLSEKQAFDYIYSSDSLNLLFLDLYLNTSKVKLNEYLTYGKASLYISNILGKTYISSEKLTFDIFKNLGLLNPKFNENDKITEGEFKKVLLFIRNDLFTFQNNLKSELNKSYYKKEYDYVSSELVKNIELMKKLDEHKISDIVKYNTLIECISGNKCSDISLLETTGLLSIKQNDDINTYKDYIKELYFLMGYDSYVARGYSLSEYEKFVDVLVEGITKNNSFYDGKITFDSYRNLQSEIILQQVLRKNILYLVENHLEKINLIYNSSKKEELLVILKEFLAGVE